jgi:predicted Zn-dependent protease
LRAREAEAQLDFTTAEADWARYVELAPDKSAAWMEKADYHKRRVEAAKEIAALLQVAALPASTADTYRAPAVQSAWKALERAWNVVTDHLLADDQPVAILRAWEQRYASERAVYARAASWYVSKKKLADAEAVIARYQKAFPYDIAWPLATRAAIERERGGAQNAVNLYDRAFRPDWEGPVLTDFFRLLDETDTRRRFVAEARQKHAADPSALDPAARLFHHFHASGNASAAERVLFELTQARAGRWTPREHLLIGDYYASLQNLDQAANRYYTAYNANNAQANNAQVSEAALSQLINLLIEHAGTPFRFGGGDLSFYADIARLDSSPGFWNGILSLLLNGQSPGNELAQQEAKATPYFHRAAAAELLRVFDARFPQSSRRASLHAQVIEAAALHAESGRVIQLGTAYLASFPASPDRTKIALLMADAYARTKQTDREFALYDTVLAELSKDAGGMPIGESVAGQNAIARSPEYPRILDRYIARLTALGEPAKALVLYRREVDRNPNDPGIYERLAAYLEQNKLGDEIEQTYRRAMQQFPGKEWSHRLARFYLRQKMNAKYDALTSELAGVFSGTELSRYLQATVTAGSLDPVLYRQVNLYAHRRFPHHLPFVRNLLAAYENRTTANPAEWDRLLRAHWMYDDVLRRKFFEYLSRTGKLDAELAQLRQQVNANPAAAVWVGEAESWKGHFETAAPILRLVAQDFPADRVLVTRAASMHRSLAAFTPASLGVAVQLEESLARAHPDDTAVLTRLGEMQAEQERYDRARDYWSRIVAIAPGRPDGYLEAATLHWDYYRYDEALARIQDARGRLNDPALFAFEAGAIHENKGDLSNAASEYVAGAMQSDGESNARQRLTRVVTRAAWRQPLEAALQRAGGGGKPLALRVALLESQNRRTDIETLLNSAVANANQELLAEIRSHAQRSGLTAVERRVVERLYALADHPAAKMRALADRMRFEESAGAARNAADAVETLLRENPRSVGAIRTSVNYFWRSNQKTRAADTLLSAANNAYPELQRQFRLEALQKLLDAGEYPRVHAEAARLLAVDPLDEQALRLKADAFGRAKDDRALTALYRDTLSALQQSKLAPAVRATRIAAMRRAWIPALLRLNDATGAADQYIELLKQYSDDEALLREAARFALENNQKDRIGGFFSKAETDSPRDPRWAIVRARLEMEFGDVPASLAAWGRAVSLRPERVDLLSNRAGLEERLSRFDQAVASYRKLYEISFRNPFWLEEGARVLARQGKRDECAKWLREALVDNRPKAAENHLQAADRLMSWGAYDQAHAEVITALSIVNATSDLTRVAATYARTATVLRQFDSIPAALNAKSTLVAPAGVAAWRSRWLDAAAETAAEYFTPEEKQRFSDWLVLQRPSAGWPAIAIAAQKAGLAESAARSLQQSILASPAAPESRQRLEQLVQWQQGRQQFIEVARQIEAYHRVYPNREEKAGLLSQARYYYFLGGDDASEERILAVKDASGQLSGADRDRYFDLLTRRTPVVFSPSQLANQDWMDAMTNYALRRGRTALAMQSIGGRRDALWQSANVALTGLYLGEKTPIIRKAFLDSLGPQKIGDKLALAGNRDSVLTGDTWFDYAGRYGAWLELNGDATAPDYLAAVVERRSNSANAYMAMAEEAGGDAAIRAYQSALLLDPHQPVAYARLAKSALAKGDRTAALAHYQKAFEELRWWADNRGVQEWFWPEAAQAMRDAKDAGLTQELKDSIDGLLRGYVKRNGSYRVKELLEGMLYFAGPSEGVAWIARLSRSAGDPAAFLSQLRFADNWLPAEGRDVLFRLQIDLADEAYNAAAGDQRAFLRNEADWARYRYASYLLDQKKADAAGPLVGALASSPEYRAGADFQSLRLRWAAMANRFNEVVGEVDAEPELLRVFSDRLRKSGFETEARILLRRSFELDIRRGNVASAQPGLAALYLKEGDAARALVLLQAYVMQAPVPFTHHASAAEVLLQNNRKEDAARLLEALSAAEPWNRTARALLAEARADAPAMAAIAGDAQAPYALRVRVARWIGANKKGPLQSGSGELDYLASGAYSDRAAEQPLWAEARRAAAEASRDQAVKARLYRGVLSMMPNDHAAIAGLFRALTTANRWREAAAAIEGNAFPASTMDDRARQADAWTRTGQLARALNAYDSMAADETDPARRRRWEQAKANVRAVMEREQKNEGRRPTVSEGLEQEHTVLPRLTAAAQGGAR